MRKAKSFRSWRHFAFNMKLFSSNCTHAWRGQIFLINWKRFSRYIIKQQGKFWFLYVIIQSNVFSKIIIKAHKSLFSILFYYLQTDVHITLALFEVLVKQKPIKIRIKLRSWLFTVFSYLIYRMKKTIILWNL
jgi:hypothetical protein